MVAIAGIAAVAWIVPEKSFRVPSYSSSLEPTGATPQRLSIRNARCGTMDFMLDGPPAVYAGERFTFTLRRQAAIAKTDGDCTARATMAARAKDLSFVPASAKLASAPTIVGMSFAGKSTRAGATRVTATVALPDAAPFSLSQTVVVLPSKRARDGAQVLLEYLRTMSVQLNVDEGSLSDNGAGRAQPVQVTLSNSAPAITPGLRSDVRIRTCLRANGVTKPAGTCTDSTMDLSRHSRTGANMTVTSEHEGPLEIQALITVAGMVDGVQLPPMSATFVEPVGTANYAVRDDVHRISRSLAFQLAAASGLTIVLALLATAGMRSVSRRRRGRHATARWSR
jgi:hypothetical protein